LTGWSIGFGREVDTVVGVDYSELSSPTAGLGIVIGAPSHLGPARPRLGDDDLIAVDAHLLCLGAYHRAGWAGTDSRTWLRPAIAERLVLIEGTLPDGFGLAIFDGWRSDETVRALYDHYYGPGSTLAPGYLAPPSDDPSAPPPPHLTGAAVDLTLSWHGAPLSLGTPYDEFSERAHLDALDGVPDDHPDALDRDLRRLLHRTMTAGGFAPYDQEWWHYSWGDDAWATWSGEPAALYGATSPSR